ncbi:hypothetical protein SPSIL_034880 [Sporomusa silvacetica DSM 10669]|uniref:Permease n=1 Tax=Sporomusa silvacetica DSM 10669 TaxID=1123289 RepID=A0ABZ3IPF8_9FIRM|nr:permease [Sporomusa silvacetica]OZC19224.1 putative permease [Sporomusa silvacetica DSM 10669]
MYTIGLYCVVCTVLLISYTKDKKKTMIALKKAWKSFENILPQLLSIIIIIGIVLAILSPDEISALIGQQSGWLGIFVAAIIGSITLIPGFVTFPLAAALLKSGAGFMQIVVFISTSMMVGVVTAPVEIQYFGRKVTYIRNSLALLFSFIVAAIIGVILI